MTGTAVAAFKPVDDAIRRFMRERCVGGAVVGIAYQGAIVHNRGYGYKDGPPSGACATAKDPFIGGDKILPNTPFRIGSNSKAILAAVLRIELKKALAAKRGVPVTDADIEALKLIDNGELELVSPAVRSAMIADGLGGFITEACPIVDAWRKVTVGQLLEHKSGLPRSSEDPYEELSKIRGLNSAAKLTVQETASGAPAAAKTALKDDRGNNAYFVPPFTLEEFAIAQGNRCFAYEPGTKYNYSNSGFTLLGYVLEHITGKSFNAKNGYPFMHSWSLLSDFTEAELGFNVGIELSHLALGKRDPAEPRYRHWRDNSYYAPEKDDKRPWCVLSGGHCNFDTWAADDSSYNWEWKQERVPFTYGNHQVMGGVGALAAEAPKYLAFMNRFYVRDPDYGKDRSLFAQLEPLAHRGSLDGTESYVAQFNGDSIVYRHFTNRPNGTMSFDRAKASNHSCSVPPGVNFFFAMNQRSDAKCTFENECQVWKDETRTESYSAYSQFPEVLKEALCKVQWNNTK
jgi:Beta-lactamase